MQKILSLFCILLLLSAGAALAEENLMVNGDFSGFSGDFPEGWDKEVWYTDVGVSDLAVVPDGYEGPCIMVSNASDNDARFSQTVSVRPDALYRISCMCRAEGVGETGVGATISIKDTFCYSEALTDTDGEWVLLELYGRTGPDQTEVTVYARVGGYGLLSTGTAWFDNFEMTEISEVPEGVVAGSFFTPEPAADVVFGGAAEETVPPRNTEMYVLLICIFMLTVLAVVRKHRRAPERSLRYYTGGMLLLTLAAFLIRAVLAVRVHGYHTDINCFTAWADRMFSVGPLNFYAPDAWCDYPPGYMLMLAPVAALRQLFGLSYFSGGQLFLLKLWPILFDLAAAWLIWYAAKPKLGGRGALLLSAFFALNPAVFTDSAAWGQIDSIFTLLIALCALKADEERFLPSLLCFAAAALIKPQALLFAPLGLFAVVWRVFTSRNPGRALRSMLIAVAAAFGLLYVVALLFSFDPALGLGNIVEPVRWLWTLYGGTMTGYSYVSVNALNLYYLLGMNWEPAASHPFVMGFAWICFAQSYLFCAAMYVCSGSRKTLPLLGGVLIVLIFTFGPMIHERYIFPAILLLLLAYVYQRDKRLLISLTVLSATLFLNELLVLQGGMTAANYGHLQPDEHWLNSIVAMLNVLNAGFLCWTAVDLCLLHRVYPLAETKPETVSPGEYSLMHPTDHRLHLKRIDVLLMTAVTLVYSVVAFVNLGTVHAPQTSWTSEAAGETVVLDLGETQTFRLTYYGGICDSNFTVELSNDGENWTAPYYAKYNQGEIFRWLWYVPQTAGETNAAGPTVPTDDGSAYVTFAGHQGELYPLQTARYVRLTSVAAGLILSETGFLDENGEPLPVTVLSGPEDARALIDEQHTVPDHPSYYNSTYFDEIYHARTAYEHLHGLNTYEWTHPPLGKVVMMLGIQLFGMTPFGWRFMGCLMGVMMLPLMYLLVRQLTKSTKLSFLAMFLMSVDSMHFTQTRIATIDSYAVFWIMLMYFFMFRYFRMRWGSAREFRRSLIPLGLCGVTMGVAWATKWIGLYASVGLAILFFWSLYRRFREYRYACGVPQGSAGRHGRLCDDAAEHFVVRAVVTVLFCVVFFVIIPVLIYYFSHYWHLQSHGVDSFADMFSMKHIQSVITLQESIFSYHSGLSGDTHWFRSEWYEWPIIWWPMWFYSGTAYVADGMISSISCMGNPAVWWFGLAAMLFVIVRMCMMTRAPKVYVLIVIGVASQFLPWVLVPRSTFIYHYFASVPFIIIASVLLLDWIRKQSPAAWKAAAITLCTAALVLFIAFYPLESGMPVARSYAQYLRWFQWYNF